MNLDQSKLRFLWVAAIALCCFAGTLFITHPEVSATSSTSVSGLATLRAMAQQSVPYQTAVANNKPTLLEFYANWCTTCQSMAPSLKQLHHRYGKAVNFVMLNVDDPQWMGEIEKYRVNGVPQLTFLKSDRQVAKTLVGRVPETILVQLFEQIQNPNANLET